MRKTASKLNVDYQAVLVGREAELDALLELLCRKEIRILTLTGAAGIGKTRLAAEAVKRAARLFSRTVFLDLTLFKSASRVLPAVAQSLGLKGQSGALLPERLTDAVGSADILLVLDNCDHVLKIKTELEALAEGCPNLKILATSRELFRSKWEVVFPVGPLRTPDRNRLPAISELNRIPSVSLLLAQVQKRIPDFKLTADNAAAVADLSVCLDGIPLAILLAAGRIENDNLQQSISSFKNSAGTENPEKKGERHGTLRTALDWSHSYLKREEKELLRRLSVFRGTWTVQEAAGICAGGRLHGEDIPTILNRLSDASLIQPCRRAEGKNSYRLLETVRSYAKSKLKSVHEEKQLFRRYRDWFLVWAEQGEPGIWRAEAPEWLAQLEQSYDDLWAAMEWCRDTEGEASCGLRIWASVVGFYDLRGRVSEGIQIARQLLLRSSGCTPARARTLLQAAVLLRSQGDLAGARLLVNECLAFASDLGDIFDSIAALCTLGSLEHIENNKKEAKRIFQKALLLSRNCYESEPRVLYVSLFWLGSFVCFEEQYERAVKILKQAAVEARKQGCILFECRILAILGRALVGVREYGQAGEALLEGITCAEKLKYHEISALCLNYLAMASWARKRNIRACRFLTAAKELRKQVGVVYWFPDRSFSAMSAALEADHPGQKIPSDHMLPEEIIAWAAGSLMMQAGGSMDHEAEKLTLREQEVCELVTRGLNNREIAGALRISRRTVDTHIRHILNRLDLNTRAQISAWYERHRRGAR